MTNAEVIQTMTVAELTNLLNIMQNTLIGVWITPEWLRADSQAEGGLLTDEWKKYWKVH